MRADTSGLLYTKNRDGSIRIEVIDYGVEEFDGRDWECWYDLSKENAKLLYKELKKIHNGRFEQMLVAEFGKTFDIPKFIRFCKEHGIKYNFSTWS